ncbi:hypothetical protein BDA96_10G193300 [Sorghum bicolor]|uniref:EF-hand domain-containing protein n=1 Tax=Sorghum bicolor TaxID=4558 RepID=A0A921Q2P2_SORBI|nr:hypothetical protein BDA96_10G193300 [Sorghum bicolor]
MLASFGRDGDGDGEVSAASKLRGLCLCMRDASNEDMGALVTSVANTGGDGGLLDEEDELAREQAEAAGEAERRTTTTRSLKLVLARLGARRNITECQAIICRFDMDSDGVLSFNEFRTMMTA